MKFSDFGAEYRPRIDRFLGDFFAGRMRAAPLPVLQELYRDLAEFINRDGKRIRPLLLMAGYLGYGGRRGREAVPLASVLEILHALFLIQDDIIDRAALRRGKPSLHLVLGEKYAGYTHTPTVGADIAIVLPDILFADSLEIVVSSSFPGEVRDRFLKAYSLTLRVTAWGQVLDSLYSMARDPEGAGEVPAVIGRMKTAYYTILYPLQMGRILAGRDDEQGETASLERFALPLGSAFQVRDDILGLFGTEEQLGKPADSDLREGKLTLLVRHALETMPEASRERFLGLFLKNEKTDVDVSALRGMIGDTGARERAQRELADLTGTARAALGDLSMEEEYREVLSGLVDLVAEA